ncbi:hypothetical protein TIFTF001_010430 [Ficus carica]|uniref:Uncharacterized protein n=1 Tax=Ficus carica TaxID=3494 RepID=A0AA88D3E1_FICCA|nr:hypothetical protein TIFTF001_010430 [Ficus carica]
MDNRKNSKKRRKFSSKECAISVALAVVSVNNRSSCIGFGPANAFAASLALPN